MVVPEPKRARTLQRHVNQLQRSTKSFKQRPPRAEPIYFFAGNPRARGGGWKRLVVGNEKQAHFHIAHLNKHVRLEVKKLLFGRERSRRRWTRPLRGGENTIGYAANRFSSTLLNHVAPQPHTLQAPGEDAGGRNEVSP